MVQATDAALRPQTPPASTGAWQEAPALAALFAPRAYRHAYRAFVSPRPLADAIAAVADDAASLHPPGAWRIASVGPWDAFGQGGSYDRARLARLYGSRRAAVARGPRGRDDRVVESWALVSPYPSPALDRLEAGTLLLVLRLPD